LQHVLCFYFWPINRLNQSTWAQSFVLTWCYDAKREVSFSTLIRSFLSGQACNPPDPRWFFSYGGGVIRYTMKEEFYGTKVAHNMHLIENKSCGIATSPTQQAKRHKKHKLTLPHLLGHFKKDSTSYYQVGHAPFTAAIQGTHSEALELSAGLHVTALIKNQAYMPSDPHQKIQSRHDTKHTPLRNI